MIVDDSEGTGRMMVNYNGENGCGTNVFAWFDSLHPINNLLVEQGRVLLGWTSTKLG